MDRSKLQRPQPLFALLGAYLLLIGCGEPVPSGYVANADIRRRAATIDASSVSAIELLGMHLTLPGTDPNFVGGDPQQITSPSAISELVTALRSSCRRAGTEEPLRTGSPDQLIVRSKEGDTFFDFQWETLDRDHGPIPAALLKRYAQR